MKKSVFGIFGLLVMALCFWSCGNSNTPSKVVEKSIEYVQDKNYEAYVDLIQIEEKGSKTVEEQKKQLVALLQGKLDQTLESKQGLASCEILSEEIEEDGNTAVVKTKITYGDGTTEDQKFKLLKNADGEWKLNAKK